VTSRQLSEDGKTIQCSLAIGFLEIVRSLEHDINPKSARSRALDNLIDNSWKVVDQFRVNSFPPAKLRFASDVLDAVESLVNDMTSSYYKWNSWWQ